MKEVMVPTGPSAVHTPSRTYVHFFAPKYEKHNDQLGISRKMGISQGGHLNHVL